MHRHTARVDPRHQGGEGVAGTPGACSQVFCHPIRCTLAWRREAPHMVHRFAIDHKTGVTRRHLQSQSQACKLACRAGLPQISWDGPETARDGFVCRVAENEAPRRAFHFTRELLCTAAIAVCPEVISAQIPGLNIQDLFIHREVLGIWRGQAGPFTLRHRSGRWKARLSVFKQVWTRSSSQTTN